MRKRQFLSLAVLLTIIVSLAACATLTVTQSAETLAALGEQFLSSARQIDDAYKAGQIPEADYAKWRAFVPKFKLGWTQAEQALQTARVAGQTETPAQTAILIRALKDQLLALALQLYGGKP